MIFPNALLGSGMSSRCWAAVILALTTTGMAVTGCLDDGTTTSGPQTTVTETVTPSHSYTLAPTKTAKPTPDRPTSGERFIRDVRQTARDAGYSAARWSGADLLKVRRWVCTLPANQASDRAQVLWDDLGGVLNPDIALVATYSFGTAPALLL